MASRREEENEGFFDRLRRCGGLSHRSIRPSFRIPVANGFLFLYRRGASVLLYSVTSGKLTLPPTSLNQALV